MVSKLNTSGKFKALVILGVALLASIARASNFYELLGIPRESNEGEIKRAFRKLSLKYHPDKNPGREKRHLNII
jgi:preprotein translocase subunit Sec63